MDSTEVKYNPNPREKANIFSIIFFGFTLPTFRTGLKKDIDVDDVYNTLSNDRSERLVERLERNWKAQLNAAAKNPKKKPSLLKAVAKTFWVEYALLGLLTGFGDLVLRTFQPTMLEGVLKYYANEEGYTKLSAYFYAVGMISFTLANCLVMSQYMVNAGHAGMRVRASVCALLYRKATRLSRTALGDTPPGKVVNLLSNDVSRFNFASMIIQQLWIGPVSSIIVIIMLYQRAGLPGIAGIILIFIMSPLQAYSGKLAARYRKMTAMKTDERIRLMDEVILGMQVIKMYAWEKPFEKVIAMARKAEIRIIQRNAYIRALFMTLGMVTTRLALFSTLLTIALTGGDITAAKVFVLMSYFNMLSQTLTGIFTRGLTEIAEMFVSLKRLQQFLANEEYKYEQFNNITLEEVDKTKAALTVNNVTAKWNASMSDSTLTDINLEVGRGKFIGIIGPVGSGKSSLLQTLLGELDIVHGDISANGKYSYCSQEPWIFANTIRQNIVFGAEYNKKRYKEVIRVCALEKDLDAFPKRDLTIVGDKGASLSGGQKARITLARAVYRERDIYLLDDPLSAVDIHVSKVLYEDCINGFLANKTRILVTHQVHYLKNADKIIILNNGKIEKEGTFDELANSDNLYAQLLTSEPEITDPDKTNQIEYDRQESKQSRKFGPRPDTEGDRPKRFEYGDQASKPFRKFGPRPDTEGDRPKRFEYGDQASKPFRKLGPRPDTEGDRPNQIEYDRQVSKQSRKSRKSSIVSVISSKSLVESILEESDSDSEEEYQMKRPRMRDMQEESSKGKVLGSLLLQYFRTGANCISVALILILYVSVQGAGSLVDYFISFWTNIEYIQTLKNQQLLTSTTSIDIANSTEDIVSTTIMPAASNSTANISDPVHLSELETIMANSWFEYPEWSTETCLFIYGGLLLVVISLTLGRSFSFYTLAMRCSKNLHRSLFKGIINAKMRFFETNPSGRILNRFANDIGSIDDVIPRVLLDGGQMMLQIVGSLVLVSSANPYCIILAVGLAIVSGLLRKVYLKTSKNLKRVEGMLRSPIFTHLNATLQGLTTIRALRAEPILESEFDKIQNYHISAWFMNITAAQAFGLSLNLLSSLFITILVFSILTFDEELGLMGGTVGLAISQANTLTNMIQMAMRVTADIANQLLSVERVLEYERLPPEPQPNNPKPLPKNWPDSGKIEFHEMKFKYWETGPIIIKDLTLTINAGQKVGIVGRTGAGKSSLIGALFRLANVEGKIIIDGVDTKDVNLMDLRSKISIIPQDPVLFSGTLRYNLDPFNDYPDEKLYRALQEVELKDPNNIINRLENRVMDRGSNYSVGQRQLICLARAIIRNNKILMLDEATANVDPQTDALIQKTIRTKFDKCTVLTVAHRLNTIMDSDKVLVMVNGKAAEFDHPHILLQDENSLFSKMVNDTGKSESEMLKKVAKTSYDNSLS
ncbi:ATP-binding cassette sub-family C member 4-like [Diorhabda sublineata]|uniref:ATP-binding cassette sub-family C member 4-like n=1 Tax=Diorhabda sublineata TaxID=1163346 RepID=UPI0024E168C6|nr:ATP-binding cassette sub-family C member 4-like [Diorhabda sublineata]XP_056648646.1 ATP-binding cassette sub-family C member 4-like [Diorhabda sublineata]XP_056648651.1 ATP-binding cassette sub-family C member 4-like [Diorhabda sublineata]XP_056648657.1 ATP-binding cassette sub-family C member 4-like [Diorhabda sublineata]